MPEHSNKQTFGRFAWCNVCNNNTLHHVWDGRLGRCTIDHPRPEEKKKPEPVEDKQGDLF